VGGKRCGMQLNPLFEEKEMDRERATERERVTKTDRPTREQDERFRVCLDVKVISTETRHSSNFIQLDFI
jgi:hypothetical protein